MSKIFVNVDGINIEATGEVLQDILDFQAKCKLEKEGKEAEAKTKATQRQAILDRLGLTEDEARLLLG
jgi:hypothetical protein